VYKNLIRSSVGLVFIMLLVLFLHFKKGEDNLALKVDEIVRVHCPIQSQTCLIHLANGIKLNISLSPNGLPALELLTLQLKSSHIDFHQLTHFEASFEGLDMEMGRHSLTLSPPITSNMLRATGLIPLCPMDPMMHWVLNVKFQYQNKVTLLTFEVPSGPR
jgi:hypothetical protein